MRTPAALQALAHPLRIAILETLRDPAAAATIARRLGESRQKVNYHLKELEHAGLVVRVRERRIGNFVETIYRSVSRSYVISPEVAWADPRRLETLRAQHSLETLVLMGERLQRDAAALLDRATFDGEEIASAAVSAVAGFADEEARVAFLNEYVEMVAALLSRHGSRGGTPYRVAMAAYPDPGTSDAATV